MKKVLGLLILLNISVFLYAETVPTLSNTEIEEYCVDQVGHRIVFYGVLDIWHTPSGTLIIDCNPPFISVCYTLWWSLENPLQQTVILNDENQTEITVTSDPIITIGENGEQIHTFSR